MKSEVIAIVTVGILATGTIGGLMGTLIGGVNDRIDVMQAAVGALDGGLTSRIDTLDARVDDMNGRLKSVETVILNQGKKLAELENAASDQNVNLADYLAIITENRNAIVGLSGVPEPPFDPLNPEAPPKGILQ